VGARFSAPVQTGPEAHPATCTMGTGVKIGRGVRLTPHPLLVPWSRKGKAIPLLPLWAVRPVQSLSACTRVHFTFTSILVERVVEYADGNINETRNALFWVIMQPVWSSYHLLRVGSPISRISEIIFARTLDKGAKLQLIIYTSIRIIQIEHAKCNVLPSSLTPAQK